MSGSIYILFSDGIGAIDKLHLSVHIARKAGEGFVILGYVHRCLEAGNKFSDSSGRLTELVNTLLLKGFKSVGKLKCAVAELCNAADQCGGRL